MGGSRFSKWLQGGFVAAIACASGSSRLRPRKRSTSSSTMRQVITVDRAFSLKTAVAVKGERIVAVGGEELLQTYAAPKVIDLGGRTLDARLSPTRTSIPNPSRQMTSLWKRRRALPKCRPCCAPRPNNSGPGKWITGYGWQESNFAENRNSQPRRSRCCRAQQSLWPCCARVSHSAALQFGSVQDRAR